MRLTTRFQGDTLIARLSGELDLHAAPVFRKAIDEALEESPHLRNLILNLQEVTFVDSSGLGALLGRYRILQRRGGQMVAVSLQPRVRKLFEMSGLLKIIKVVDNESQALERV